MGLKCIIMLSSDKAKENKKGNIFFDVCLLVFDIFHLFFYLFGFRLMWKGY